jgi:hypothetical protein
MTTFKPKTIFYSAIGLVFLVMLVITPTQSASADTLPINSPLENSGYNLEGTGNVGGATDASLTERQNKDNQQTTAEAQKIDELQRKDYEACKAEAGAGGAGGTGQGNNSNTNPSGNGGADGSSSNGNSAGDEQTTRNALSAEGINVNNANNCEGMTYQAYQAAHGTSCTDVAGMPQGAVDRLGQIRDQSGAESIMMIGGTEAGHQSHGPGNPVVDLERGNTNLNRWIGQHTVSTVDDSYGTWHILDNGDRFLDEGNHWHAVLRGSAGGAVTAFLGESWQLLKTWLVTPIAEAIAGTPILININGTTVDVGNVGAVSSTQLDQLVLGLSRGGTNSLFSSLSATEASALITKLPIKSLNQVFNYLTPTNINSISSALGSGGLGQISGLLTSGTAENLLSGLSTGNLNSLLSGMGSGPLNTILGSVGGSTLTSVFGRLSGGVTNSLMGQLGVGALNNVFNNIGGNLGGSLLSGLGGSTLNNVIGNLGGTALNGVMGSLSSGTLNGLMGNLSGGALNNLMGGLNNGVLNQVMGGLSGGVAGNILSGLGGDTLNQVMGGLGAGPLANAVNGLGGGDLSGIVNGLDSGTLSKVQETLGNTPAGNAVNSVLNTAGIANPLGGLGLYVPVVEQNGKLMSLTGSIDTTTKQVKDLSIQICTHLKAIRRIQSRFEIKEFTSEVGTLRVRTTEIEKWRNAILGDNGLMQKGGKDAEGNDAPLYVANLTAYQAETKEEAKNKVLIDIASSSNIYKDEILRDIVEQDAFGLPFNSTITKEDIKKIAPLQTTATAQAPETSSFALANIPIIGHLAKPLAKIASIFGASPTWAADPVAPTNQTSSEDKWSIFLKLMEPKNNRYGSFIQAISQLEESKSIASENADQTYLAGQGFLPTRECEQWVTKAGTASPTANSGQSNKVCAKWKTIVPGIINKESYNSALDARRDQYVNDPNMGSTGPGNGPDSSENATGKPAGGGGGAPGPAQAQSATEAPQVVASTRSDTGVNNPTTGDGGNGTGTGGNGTGGGGTGGTGGGNGGGTGTGTGTSNWTDFGNLLDRLMGGGETPSQDNLNFLQLLMQILAEANSNQAPLIQFKAKPLVNNQSLLYWASPNATTCTAGNNWLSQTDTASTTPKKLGDSLGINANLTITYPSLATTSQSVVYKINCQNANGTKSSSVTIQKR